MGEWGQCDPHEITTDEHFFGGAGSNIFHIDHMDRMEGMQMIDVPYYQWQPTDGFNIFVLNDIKRTTRLLLEAFEIAFTLCNFQFERFGFGKVNCSSPLQCLYAADAVPNMLGITAISSEGARLNTIFRPQVMTIVNQIMPTAYVVNTSYWVYYFKGIQSCICQRFRIPCVHCYNGIHWVNMGLTPLNQYFFSEAPTKIKITNSKIYVIPQFFNQKTYECVIRLEYQLATMDYYGQLHPINAENYGSIIQFRYNTMVEFTLAGTHIQEYHPHPALHPLYGSHFPELIVYSNFLSPYNMAFNLPTLYTLFTMEEPVVLPAHAPIFHYFPCLPIAASQRKKRTRRSATGRNQAPMENPGFPFDEWPNSITWLSQKVEDLSGHQTRIKSEVISGCNPTLIKSEVRHGFNQTVIKSEMGHGFNQTLIKSEMSASHSSWNRSNAIKEEVMTNNRVSWQQSGYNGNRYSYEMNMSQMVERKRPPPPTTSTQVLKTVRSDEDHLRAGRTTASAIPKYNHRIHDWCVEMPRPLPPMQQRPNQLWSKRRNNSWLGQPPPEGMRGKGRRSDARLPNPKKKQREPVVIVIDDDDDDVVVIDDSTSSSVPRHVPVRPPSKPRKQDGNFHEAKRVIKEEKVQWKNEPCSPPVTIDANNNNNDDDTVWNNASGWHGWNNAQDVPVVTIKVEVPDEVEDSNAEWEQLLQMLSSVDPAI